VLARLGHWTIGCGTDEDGTVHLSGTRDHVLDVVGVSWTVDVCVVTLLGFVLHVCGVDRNTALTLLRSVVEIGIIAEDRLAEAIIVNKDMNMVRFYLQTRNHKYMMKQQLQFEDPTIELAKLLSKDE
jgi:hypothetical protein